ncbi:MAG: mercury methylation corrinoid protein HgcA [Planctomycetota bacterium]|jgi:acetyl-CoA decarbonylase/synthase complex subunit gamma
MRPCCGRQTTETAGRLPKAAAPWIIGSVQTPLGEVPRLSTSLRPADRLRAWKVRWGIGRMRYTVQPGLYAVGSPEADSPVLVSANYKLSFDRLRSQLGGLDAWILVLDTRGINVWCAAGKGTFGTEELVRQIEAARLAEVVNHRVLVVPQLGAPGVAAHEVKRQSGFRVQYGPVRAEDLPAFLAANMKATPEMRRVHFRLRDRVAVIPVELATSVKYAVLIAVGFFLLAGLGPGVWAWDRVVGTGLLSAALFLGTWAGSAVLTPILLPWLPGRALSAKGAWLGLVFLVGLFAYACFQPEIAEKLKPFSATAWCLLVPTVASFMAMNFTGATTYTSLSGVRREMRVAVPLQVAGAAVGVTLWLIGRFV